MLWLLWPRAVATASENGRSIKLDHPVDASHRAGHEDRLVKLYDSARGTRMRDFGRVAESEQVSSVTLDNGPTRRRRELS